MQFQGLTDTLRPAAIAIIALVLTACGSGDGKDQVTASSDDVAASKQVLVFRDDFGGPAIGARSAPRGAAARIAPAPLPSGNWVVETGYGQNGWGNDEWQRYTNSMDNLFTEDGSLVIRAKCATAPACGKRDDSITSARIITKDRLNVRYGSIRARIKMPSGLGVWPAFWTLGADIDERRWPNAGEIDIVEMHYFYSDRFTTHFATHWAGPRYTAANRPACASGVPAIDPAEEENCRTAFKVFDQPLTDDFHIYELVWNENQIVGKIDGITYFTQAIDPRTMEEFLKDHFLLLNVAVGGTLGGPFGPAMSAADWADRDQTDMLVDWVEVYEYVPAASGTLIDESGRNLKYNRIINSVEVGGAFVEFDLDSTAVTPLVGSSSLQLKYSKSVSQNGGIPAGFSGAIFDFNSVNLSSFTHFNFSIDSSRFPNFDDIGIEFEDTMNRRKLLRTSNYMPVATSGNWRTYSVPLGDFSPVDMNAIIKIGFFNPNDAADALIAGTLYVDNIVFTTRACTPAANVAFDSVNYNPATSVAQVSVSDACKANKLVTVKVENGSDEIHLGVKLDAAGNGSSIFGLIDPLSVCPTDDSKAYIALSPPLIATYTNSSRGVSYMDTATAGVDAGAPGTSLAGARDFFFATDPNQPLAYIPDAPVTNSFNYSAFGSGSIFEGAFADTTFSPVFQVRSGAGYGAEVGQLVLINIPQGFAANADTINFKYKNVGHPINGIRVEFGELGVTSNLVLVDLADTSRSTPLGDGWYQVSLPMSAFPDATNFNYFGFITPDPAPPTGSGFSFLITDINLQESISVVPAECAQTVSPGGAGDGITPEFLLFSRDTTAEPDDLAIGVDWNPQPFGSGSVFDAAYTADPDYPRAFEVTTGTGYSVPVGQLALENLAAGFASGFTTLQFKAQGLNNDFIRVKFLPNGDYIDIDLATDPNSTDLGAGWYQVSIALSSFTGVADGTALLFETDNTATSNFTFYLTDIGFSGSAGGPGAGPGDTPEVLLFSRDPVAEPDDLAIGVDWNPQPFGSGSVFDAASTADPDYDRVFEVTTGTGYSVPVGQLALEGLAAGFASTYTNLQFKARGLNNDLVRVKFLPNGDYVDINLATDPNSTDLGAGWYQVSMALSSFTGVADGTALLFETDNTAASNFTFYLTDIGFSDSVGGPGAGPGDTPEVLLFSRDPVAEPDDLAIGVDWNPQPFGSGSVFDAASTADPDYDRVFEVTTGTGYSVPVGQLALEGLAAGFASTYTTLQFKARGLNNDLVRVKFLPNGDYVDINLATDPNSTDLGAGWYQVSIALSSFTGVSDGTALLFETDNTAASNFTFYLTDIGFSGTAGGGGGAELTTNGDFEAGDLSGWTVDTGGGGATVAADNTESNGGAWSANLVADEFSGPPAVIKQVNIGIGTVASGDTIDVSFDLIGTVTAGCAVNVELISEGAGGGLSASLTPNITSTVASWTNFSFSGTTTGDVAGGITVQFVAACGAVGGAVADINIDNLSVTIGGGGGGGGAAAGITPAFLLFSRDTATEPDDLAIGVDWNPQPFGSGSVFDAAYTGDPDYPRAFEVTTGTGYSVPVGQLALENLAPGFASTFGNLQFKARGLNNDLVRVKFLPNGGYIDINLATDPNSTDLGAGWYQVSIALSAFTGVADGNALLFETDNTAASNFAFYLTDIGFSGTAGGGGAGPGIVPDVILVTSDPVAQPVDLVEGVDYSNTQAFGSGSVFDPASTVDPDYAQVFAVTTGTGYTVPVGQLAFEGFAAGFASAYASLDFKARGLNNDLLRVKFLPNGDYIDIDLATDPNSTDLGAGWYQVSIPLSGFTGVADGNALLFETDNTAASNFTFYLTDIGFSGTAGAGPGVTPEVLLFSRDPVAAPDDLAIGVDWNPQPFGSGSVFDAASTADPDYDRVFEVTTGTGYSVPVGQLALEGLAAGFASGYTTLQFKARGLNNDLVRVKFLPNGDYVDINLATDPNSTDLGFGWYQVSIALSAFTGVADANALLFETDNTAASNFTFYLTDIGFSGTAGGGGGELITNGDFEAGNLSGWLTFDNGGTVSADNTQANGGSWSGRLVSGPGNNPVLKQERIAIGTVSAGDTVTITFDVFGAITGAGPVFIAELFSETSGGPPSKAETLSGAPLFPNPPNDWTAGWVSYSFTTTLGPDVSGGISLQFVAVGGAGNLTVNVDNVSVTIQ